jgi:hypothetical protein
MLDSIHHALQQDHLQPLRGPLLPVLPVLLPAACQSLCPALLHSHLCQQQHSQHLRCHLLLSGLRPLLELLPPLHPARAELP